MAYGDAAGWHSYSSERGAQVPLSAILTSEEAAALVRAQDYVRIHYVTKFSRLIEDVASEPFASALAEAVYIAAGIEAAQPSFFSKTYTAADQKLLTKLGPMEWKSVEASADMTSSELATPRSPAIEALLGPYFEGVYVAPETLGSGVTSAFVV